MILRKLNQIRPNQTGVFTMQDLRITNRGFQPARPGLSCAVVADESGVDATALPPQSMTLSMRTEALESMRRSKTGHAIRCPLRGQTRSHPPAPNGYGATGRDSVHLPRVSSDAPKKPMNLRKLNQIGLDQTGPDRGHLRYRIDGPGGRPPGGRQWPVERLRAGDGPAGHRPALRRVLRTAIGGRGW